VHDQTVSFVEDSVMRTKGTLAACNEEDEEGRQGSTGRGAVGHR
jgi:hypothetical protein